MSCNIKTIKTCEIFSDSIFARSFSFDKALQKVTAKIQKSDSANVQNIELTKISNIFSLEIEPLNLAVGNYKITYIFEILISGKLIRKTGLIENLSILKIGCNCEKSENENLDFSIELNQTVIDVELNFSVLNIGSISESGKSAFDIAVENGFVGTEIEWLLSLKGEKGDKGEQGVQGDKGDKGDKGDTGATGLQGIQGIQGIQGEKGEKGDTGEKGDKGDNGDTGEKGYKGDKGDAGEMGLQGIQGIQGIKGDKGDNGEKVSVITITGNTTLSEVHNGAILHITNSCTLTFAANLGKDFNFVQKAFGSIVVQHVAASGVTLNSDSGLILKNGAMGSVYAPSNNNFILTGTYTTS